MAYFPWIIGSFAVLIFVLADARKVFPQTYQGKMHFGGSIATLADKKVTAAVKNHLRQENVDIAVESSSTYIRKKGFYESAYYNDMNTAGKCVHPEVKQIYGLNVCVATAMEGAPSSYVIGSIFADPTGNTYYLYEQWFQDSACSIAVTPNTYADYSSFIAICDPSWQELDVVRSEPMNPSTDNLGYTVSLYTSQSDCLTNSYQSGVVEAVYGKLGECLQASDPNDDPTAGDVQFVSCSSAGGFVINIYSSTDGSCEGDPTDTYTLDSTTVCTENDYTVNGWALGYINYGCSTVA
jgi:hypothetical protein